MPDFDLGKRLFEFAVRVIKYLRKLGKSVEYDVIKYQLTKASSSSTANYEEAQAASSKADFKNKINISLKEMRESNFWLRLIDALNNNKDKELIELIKESEELKKILGSINSKVAKSIKKNNL